MGGIPNDLSLQNNEGFMNSLDGNNYVSGDEVQNYAFDSPGVGDEAHGLEFGAGQPGGMDGVPNDDRPMPFSAQHEQTFHQPSMNFGMESIGGRASGFQPSLYHHGVNTVMSPQPMNPDGPQQSIEGTDGQDTEYSDLLTNEMEFDILQVLSPDTRLSLATLDDSTKTQVSMHETL